MSKKTSILDKEIANLLKSVREKAGLFQKEVAERMGLSTKSGKGYISHLEKGMVKNPPIGTILLYLRACGESWPEFFKELDIIDFKTRHEKMITQLPPEATQRKIQRDAMRYEIGVEFPSKEKEEFDFTRLKKQIKNKVEVLVSKEESTLTHSLSHKGRGGEEGNHQGRGRYVGIADYQKFALEFFDFLAALNKPGQKMVFEKYQRAGFERHLLFRITKIIFSVVRGEIKRIEAKKPLPTAKQEKMAIGFTKYRIRIEQIETEVHNVLCELGVQPRWFALYKDFARESYRVMKKYFGKDWEKLNQSLNELVNRWKKEGLKEEVLLKVKEKVISTFGRMRMRGMA